MQKKPFAEIDESALFWMADTDAPKWPQDFYGPFKKGIYLDFHDDVPEFIFVRNKKPSLRDLVLAQRGRQTSDKRLN